MWKRFAPRDAIGKAFQLEYAVKEYFFKTEEQKNKRAFLLLRYVRR